MWEKLRASKSSILLDSAHIENDRDGRYKRGFQALGRILAVGEPLGFRYFQRIEPYDVCYLVCWKMEDYEEVGQYMVFRMYYSRGNELTSEIGYRNFITAEVCCYYDGESPNPGRSLRTREAAIECMKEKREYHESK